MADRAIGPPEAAEASSFDEATDRITGEGITPDDSADVEVLAARLTELERRILVLETQPPEPAWLRALRKEARYSPSARYELQRHIVSGGVPW